MKSKTSYNVLYTLLFSIIFLGCAQRYTNIPRVHAQKKSNTFRSNGHYVTPPSIHEKLNTSLTVSNETYASETTKIELPHRSTTTTKNPLQFQIRDYNAIEVIDAQLPNDSLSYDGIDRDLMRGSGTMFTIATGINAALLITPLNNFVFIALLLGLGLLVLGYFVSKFIENTNQNRIRPLKYSIRQRKDRSQLKKAFNISMIISASSFAVALMTAATGSFSLPFFFFVLGMIALWGGLLVGFVYLVMGI